MQSISKTAMAAAICTLLCMTPASLLAAPASLLPAAWQDQASATTRVMGTVTAASGNSLTVQPAHGSAVTVSVPDGARVLRLEPGQKTLSAATPIPMNEISVGDRVLASGTAASGSGIDARLVVAMKKSDIAQRQQAEEQAWQQDGVGGIVKSVDPSNGTIVLAEAAQSVTIKTTPSTKIRQYASNSVAFRDAQPSTLAAIKPGAQLRAKGDQPPADGTLTANAIIFGDFQNIAGMVMDVNPSAQTLTVKDLATKKPVTLTIQNWTQLRKLPEQVAKMVGMRMQAMKHEPHGAHGHQPGGAAGNGARAGGRFNRVLERASVIPLTDLHKGDAVLVVATPGSGSQPGTAVTLLAGVEPMLRASAKASSSMFSSSWSLGGGQASGGAGGGAGDSTPQQH
ncbi:hypothetical protein ACP_3023 [Acidobacterium capsulatum ATCC 51196]|uniref:DUF5666 domain-containing protein n=2 Tax=Acidobacteriaceae TaxID=204434 RepID=C1F4I0_ACIC5|nr:hypothetical protein ACP_3023 [Acidobacterium capsulatum ATCC 51196]